MIWNRLTARGWSLQTLLLVIALALAVGAWIVGGTVMYDAALRRTQELHDLKLQQLSRMVLAFSGHELEEIGVNTPLTAAINNAAADSEDTLGRDYQYQIWSDEGKLLIANYGAPDMAPMARLRSGGFGWSRRENDDWRIYSVRDPDQKKEIQMAERASARSNLIGAIDTRMAAFGLLSLLLVVGPGLLLVRWVLRPVHDLARQLQDRSPTNLSGVVVARAPDEMTPVIDAVNRLFPRIAEAMVREREFTAVAAHELRTPLATLHVLAQLAAATDDEAERSNTLAELRRSADRCLHLQEQLLTLARLDAMRGAELDQSVELNEVIADATHDVAFEARQRGVAIASQTAAVVMTGHAFGIRTLVRNLLANGVRYTPEGGRVRVSIATSERNVILRVDDSGSGIPQADRERAFERFSRLQGDKTPGVGLGLSIVRTVAQAHEATVALEDSPMGGLRVEVTFWSRLVTETKIGSEFDTEPAALI
jgi:signal transduction histidine kinase